VWGDVIKGSTNMVCAISEAIQSQSDSGGWMLACSFTARGSSGRVQITVRAIIEKVANDVNAARCSCIKPCPMPNRVGQANSLGWDWKDANEYRLEISSIIGSEPFRHNSCSLKDASLPGKPTRDVQFRVGLPVSRRKPQERKSVGSKFRGVVISRRLTTWRKRSWLGQIKITK